MDSTSTMPVRPARQRRSLAEAHELVAAWRASGATKEGWCRAQGILRSALQSCLYRVELAESPGDDPSPAGFIAIRPPRQTGTRLPSAGVCIEVGHDVRVVGIDLPEVITLLRALREVDV